MEPQQILPIDDDTKAILIEMVKRLRPHRNELARCWTGAFRSSALKPHKLTKENSQLIILSLVDHLLEYVGEGLFDQYFREVSELAEDYIRTGLAYETLILAMHLYEEASLPLLMREYPDPRNLMPVLLAQDHLYHNVLILIASTYFRRLNAEIESRAEQLHESYTRHEQFVSMVAHELRSPLSVILGYVQLAIQTKERGAQPMADIFVRLLNQANRLRRLMEDLQDTSSINAGRFEVRKEACDLTSLVRESISQYSATGATRTLTLQADDGLITQCDSDRITQVVDNLISNAIKYSSEGSEIRVAVSRSDGEAVVSVEDRGPGIEPKDMDVLFQPFSRLYRQSRVKGTRLGLYVAKAIVEAHGGKVWAESQPGVGSKFTFTLPLV